MKKHFFTLLLLLGVAMSADAQAFERGGRYHSIGIGGAVFNYPEYSGNGWLYAYRYRPLVGMLNYQFEVGVHDYVGVGLTTGIGFRGSNISYSSGITVPVGAIGNFHFYQLIDDKVSKDIHGDKLDIYVGVNLGSGIGYFWNNGYSDVTPIWFIGPQTGVRYYFSDKVAVNLETGYGKSWVNAGITIRPSR